MASHRFFTMPLNALSFHLNDDTNVCDIELVTGKFRIVFAGATCMEFDTSGDVTLPGGDLIISGFSGGGVTGCSIDNTGKLIRTP
jgi:hypothetical protein